MGTRGAMGFVIKGEEKIGYNHFDSYPAGLGKDTLKFLRTYLGEHSVDDLRTLADALQLVDDQVPPTQEQIDKLRGFANTSVGNQELTEWYVLLRETQGDWAAVLEAGFLEDAHTFPLDSLFCEWAYILDLDAEVLEVYEGFQKKPSVGRFADRGIQPNSDGYYAATLVATYPLADLPGDEALLAIEEASNAAAAES